MSEKLEKVVETLDELTLLEAAELSKMLQEKWGVSAAAPMAVTNSRRAPMASRSPNAQCFLSILITSPSSASWRPRTPSRSG